MPRKPERNSYFFFSSPLLCDMSVFTKYVSVAVSKVSYNPKCENDCFHTPWKALEEEVVQVVSVCLNNELRKGFTWADEVAPRVEGLAMQASLMAWIPSPESVMRKATHFTKLPFDLSYSKLSVYSCPHTYINKQHLLKRTAWWRRICQ